MNFKSPLPGNDVGYKKAVVCVCALHAAQKMHRLRYRGVKQRVVGTFWLVWVWWRSNTRGKTLGAIKQYRLFTLGIEDCRAQNTRTHTEIHVYNKCSIYDPLIWWIYPPKIPQ